MLWEEVGCEELGGAMGSVWGVRTEKLQNAQGTAVGRLEVEGIKRKSVLGNKNCLSKDLWQK